MNSLHVTSRSRERQSNILSILARDRSICLLLEFHRAEIFPRAIRLKQRLTEGNPGFAHSQWKKDRGTLGSMRCGTHLVSDQETYLPRIAGKINSPDAYYRRVAELVREKSAPQLLCH